MTTEGNMRLPESKQSNPKVLYFVIIGAIFSCVAMNLITVLYQFGAFTNWKVLSSPPSRATSLVDADYAQVWVKSEDGTIFTTRLWFGCEDFCIDWKSVNSIPEQSERFSSVTNRGDDCKTLQSSIFPFNPPNSIAECTYASYLTHDLKQDGYFALGNDNEIYYWHNASSTSIRNELFWFSTIGFPYIAVSLILLVYAIGSIVNKIRLKVQNAAQQSVVWPPPPSAPTTRCARVRCPPNTQEMLL
jgi:hypothetical protein